MNDDEYELDIPNQPQKSWYPGHVYVIDYGDGETFKIGCTAVDPEKRFNQISRGDVIMPMHLVMSVETYTNCKQLEALLHMQLDNYHVKGEWFKLDIVQLTEIYQMLRFFGYVEMYDRWYDHIVPDNYHKYIVGGAIGPNYPPVTRPDFDLTNLFNGKLDVDSNEN